MLSLGETTKRRLGVVAKVAVSVGFLVVLFLNYDWGEVTALLAGLDGAALAAAVGLATAGVVIAASRWAIVLRALAVPATWGRALQLSYIGVFFNQLLPSAIGGDVVRVWRLFAGGAPLGAAVASVLLDRVLALVALAMLVAMGLPWLSNVVRDRTVALALIGVVLAILAGVAALLVADRVLALIGRFLPRLAKAVLGLSAAARTLFLSPGRAAAGIGLSLINQATLCATVLALAHGLGLALGALDALILIPPVILASVLPISIGGWGVREGAMVVALGLKGIPAEAALAVSIAFGLVLVAAAVPGGVVWLATGADRRPSVG